MTNQDLIRQYVDTGLQIPEYQFNRLSNNNKNTYIRKRLIACERLDDAIAPHEINFIPIDKKEKITQNAERNMKEFKVVSDFHFSFLSPESQKKYFEYGEKLNEKNFQSMTPENKTIYAKKLFDLGATIPDFVFDFLNDKEKQEYLLYKIDKNLNLTDKEFLSLKPELRVKYLKDFPLLSFSFLDNKHKLQYVLRYASTVHGRLGKEFLDQVSPEIRAEYEKKYEEYR